MLKRKQRQLRSFPFCPSELRIFEVLEYVLRYAKNYNTIPEVCDRDHMSHV